jgi:hypothetical protein
MLVVYNSIMLRPIVEKAIIEAYETDPTNITIDYRHFMRAEPMWEVSAQFQTQDAQHDVKVFIDPCTGKVRNIEQTKPMDA